MTLAPRGGFRATTSILLTCRSWSQQGQRGKSAARRRKCPVPGGTAHWRIAAQSGSPNSPRSLFYSPLPLIEPSGSGPWHLVFPLCTWPSSLSLLTSPTIANQQSRNPISPNPGVPLWGCGRSCAAGLRRGALGEAWWTCGAMRGPAGARMIGRVRAPAAWISAQFRFSDLISRGGKTG